MKCPLCENSNTEHNKIGRFDLFFCPECKLKFAPDFGNEAEFHNDYFQTQRVNNTKLNELREIQYEIDAKHFTQYLKSGNVLDVGCSRGSFTNKISSKGDFAFTGIDIDLSSINYANANKIAQKDEFIHSDLLNLNTAKKYNAIIFRGTFQYLSQNLCSSMLKLQSIMDKNCLIFIYSLPNSDSFVFRLIGENWVLFNPQEHKLFFNEQSLNFLSKKYDLKIKELSYPYIGTPYENLEKDYESVIEIIKGNKIYSPPFWGNIIQVVMVN